MILDRYVANFFIGLTTVCVACFKVYLMLERSAQNSLNWFRLVLNNSILAFVSNNMWWEIFHQSSPSKQNWALDTTQIMFGVSFMLYVISMIISPCNNDFINDLLNQSKFWTGGYLNLPCFLIVLFVLWCASNAIMRLLAKPTVCHTAGAIHVHQKQQTSSRVGIILASNLAQIFTNFAHHSSKKSCNPVVWVEHSSTFAHCRLPS